MKLTGVITVTLLLLAAGGTAGAAASGTPAQLVTASIAAAKKQRSVHYVNGGSFGPTHVTIVGDAAADRGIQRITYMRGTATGHLTVTMIGRALFIHGDETVLTLYMGFTPQLAAQIAGSWVAVPTTAKGYATIAAAVELRSTISELAMPGPVSQLPPSTRGGIRVIALRGQATHAGVATAETLYVRASGAPLPVAQVTRQGASTSTTTFSRWNETVKITAPKPRFVLR